MKKSSSWDAVSISRTGLENGRYLCKQCNTLYRSPFSLDLILWGINWNSHFIHYSSRFFSAVPGDLKGLSCMQFPSCLAVVCMLQPCCLLGLSRVLCLVATFHENCRDFAGFGALRLVLLHQISSNLHSNSNASGGKKKRRPSNDISASVFLILGIKWWDEEV